MMSLQVVPSSAVLKNHHGSATWNTPRKKYIQQRFNLSAAACLFIVALHCYPRQPPPAPSPRDQAGRFFCPQGLPEAQGQYITPQKEEPSS